MAEPNEKQQQEIEKRRQITDSLIKEGDYSGAIKAALCTTADIQVKFGNRQQSLLNELSTKHTDKLVPANTRTIVDAVLTPVVEGAVAAKGNPKINITVKNGKGERISLYNQDKNGQTLVNEAYPSPSVPKKIETAKAIENSQKATVKPVEKNKNTGASEVIQNESVVKAGSSSLATVGSTTLMVNSHATDLTEQVHHLIENIDVIRAHATQIGQALNTRGNVEQPPQSVAIITTDLDAVKQQAAQLKTTVENVQTVDKNVSQIKAEAKQFGKALAFVEKSTKQASPSAQWAFSNIKQGLNTFKVKANQLKEKAGGVVAASSKQLEYLKNKTTEIKERVEGIQANTAQNIDSIKSSVSTAQATLRAKKAEAKTGIQGIKTGAVRDFELLKRIVDDAKETVESLKRNGKKQRLESKIERVNKVLETAEAVTSWANQLAKNVSSKLVAKAAMQAVSRGEERIRSDSYVANGYTISQTNVPGRYKLIDLEQQCIMLFEVNEAGKVTNTLPRSDYNFVDISRALNAEVVRTTMDEMEKAHDSASAAVAQTARSYLEHSAKLDGSAPTTDSNVRASHKGKTYTYTLSKKNTLTIEHKTKGTVLRQDEGKKAVSNLSGKDIEALMPAVKSHQQSQQKEGTRETASAGR